MTHTSKVMFDAGRSDIPDWALKRPKPVAQSLYDLAMAGPRMAFLPDYVCEQVHLTSLRAERYAAVLPQVRGRLLDVGAGDNMLVRLYRARVAADRHDETAAEASVGVDVEDWGGGCVIVDSSDALPFADASFDTVSFVACLNHIPERAGALREAHRLLRPGGRVLITMIGRLIGKVGHAIWWYSEDKHREMHPEEEMGLDPREVRALLTAAGFTNVEEQSFLYGLNRLTIGTRF